MTHSNNRISKIEVFQVDLPFAEGRYSWSGGNFVEIFDSTVVAITTQSGLCGHGEVCPLGPAYLPAFAEGARAAIAGIAPELIGLDPTELAVVNDRMDRALRGHGYAKSALDMACWDLLGKVTGLPLVTLLGGRRGETFPLYRAISQESPSEMAEKIERYRAEGYSKFQLKVGGDPEVDIERIETVIGEKRGGEVVIADANTGWTQHDAIRIAQATKDLDLYIEQPCRSYRECLVVRSHTNRPFILDEVIDSVDTLVEGVEDRAMDVINLKISKVGGLTKARQIRDLAVSLGIALTIEDTWGSDITTAAIAHLAHSTPEGYLFSSTDFNSYVTVSTAEGAPQRHSGRMAAPGLPGLGINPRSEVLGQAVFTTS